MRFLWVATFFDGNRSVPLIEIKVAPPGCYSINFLFCKMKKLIYILALGVFYFTPVFSQDKRIVDSLIEFINTHPKIDSQYIITLHRISYQLNEKDIGRSFIYYEKVADLSD